MLGVKEIEKIGILKPLEETREPTYQTIEEYQIQPIYEEADTTQQKPRLPPPRLPPPRLPPTRVSQPFYAKITEEEEAFNRNANTRKTLP